MTDDPIPEGGFTDEEMALRRKAEAERAREARMPRPPTDAQMTYTYRDGAYQGYGDGKPECPHCRGKGVIDLPPDPASGRLVPATRKCICVLARDVLANVEQGWPGLTKAPKIPGSPLRGLEAKNLRITAPTLALKAHLRHVAVRMGVDWYFLVSSDADLMRAWLASTAIEGKDIFDPDAMQVSVEYFRLEDMVVPPALLVIHLGVKAARNKAMPEVLLETLRLRTYQNKPTWIVDQPSHRFQQGHIAYSDMVEAEVAEWPHLALEPVFAPGSGDMPPITDWNPPAQAEAPAHPGSPDPEHEAVGEAPADTGMSVLMKKMEEDAAKGGKRKPKAKDRRDRT